MTVQPSTMLEINTLYQDLESVSRRHNRLKEQFEEFAKQIETYLTGSASPLKGITIDSKLASKYIEVRFAGRLLRFAFSSAIPKPGDLLTGLIHVYQVEEALEKQYFQIGI